MKFRPEKRRNPFDNWLVNVCAHVAAHAGMVIAIYWSLTFHSWVPLIVAFAVLIGIEGLWLYYRLRH